MSLPSTGLGHRPLGSGFPLIPKWGKISTWCALTDWGRTKTYQAIADGVLRAKKFDKTTLIDIEHGLGVIESLPDAQISTGRSKRGG